VFQLLRSEPTARCHRLRRDAADERLLEISPPCPRPSGSGPIRPVRTPPVIREPASTQTSYRLPRSEIGVTRELSRPSATTHHCDRGRNTRFVSALRLCGGGGPRGLAERTRRRKFTAGAYFSECRPRVAEGRSDEVSARVRHWSSLSLAALARVVLVHPKGSVCGERADRGCPTCVFGGLVVRMATARLASLRLLADVVFKVLVAPDRESTTRWNASGRLDRIRKRALRRSGRAPAERIRSRPALSAWCSPALPRSFFELQWILPTASGPALMAASSLISASMVSSHP